MTNPDYLLLRPELYDLLRQGDERLQSLLGEPRSYRKGAILVHAGEASHTVYRLESGWAVRYRQLPNREPADQSGVFAG